jgi:hypothetical protein
MISFTRSASIAPGKTREAMAFAVQIAKLVKDKYGITIEIRLPVGGNPNRIAWHARYESLAEWDISQAYRRRRLLGIHSPE